MSFNAPYKTPQENSHIFPSSFTLSSRSSVASDASFLSQVPLPYHYKEPESDDGSGTSLMNSFNSNNNDFNEATSDLQEITRKIRERDAAKNLFLNAGFEVPVQQATDQGFKQNAPQAFMPAFQVRQGQYGRARQSGQPNVDAQKLPTSIKFSSGLNHYGPNPASTWDFVYGGMNPNQASWGQQMPGQYPMPGIQQIPSPYQMPGAPQVRLPYSVPGPQQMPAPYHIAGTQQVLARNKIGNLSQYSWNPQAPSFTMGQVRNQTPLTNAQYFPLQTRLPLAQWDVTSFNSIGNLRIIGGNSINSGIASTSGGIGNSGIGGYIPYGTAVNGQTINEKAAVLNEARFREATIAKGLSTATGVFAIDAGRGQQGAVAERVQNKKFDSKSFKTTAKKPKKKKNKAPAGAVAEQASQTINAPGPAPSSTSDTGTSTTEVDYSVGLVVQTPSNKVSIPQPTPTTVIHAFESTPFASVDTALHEAPSTIKPKKKGRLLRKMVQSIVEPGMSRRERIWAERGAEAQAAAQAAAQKADELPKCAAVSSESATSALVRVPQNKENLDVFLNTPPPMPGRSLQLASLAPIKPTLATVLDMSNIPFAETARTNPSSCTTGLIKICNIPWTVTSEEIIASLGPGILLPPEQLEPVSIIIDRMTSKTMDCFVEVVTHQEANFAVGRFYVLRSQGVPGILRNMFLRMHAANHGQLMEELFIRAKNVRWVGNKAIIEPSADDNDPGFAGFVTREELAMMVKHAEVPYRSPYSRDRPQRPYECLISTLIKYPWHCVDIITIGERDGVYECAFAMCKQLVCDAEIENSKIDARLVCRVKRAAITCKGFSEVQKANLAAIFKMAPVEAGLPPFADMWVFKCIGAKRALAQDVLLYYMALIREANASTSSSTALISLADLAALGQQDKPRSPFGELKIEYPQEVSTMTLAAAARCEWNAIEAALRKVLPAE